MPFMLALAVSAVLLLQISPAIADAQTAGQPKPVEATIGSTQQFDFRSTINGEDYRVRIYIPHNPPPAGGYPVLYVLDGDALFGTFAEAVRDRSLAGEIEAAVVVGISGGPGDNTADRTFDFTPTDISENDRAVMKEFGPNSKFGGYEQFFRVIQEEIKPRVAAIAKVDQGRTSLFGWSLGGQCVMRTLFVHPGAFSAYLALSPSLWWNNRALFREIPVFEQKVLAGGDRPRLYLGVGSLEEVAPVGLLADSMTYEELAMELRYARMVRNTKKMALTLQTFYTLQHMTFASHVFSGETHNSVPWAAVNPVLNFALPARR